MLPMLPALAGTSNAAPEWQAGSLGWRSGKMTAACPLEGHVSQHLPELQSLLRLQLRLGRFSGKIISGFADR